MSPLQKILMEIISENSWDIFNYEMILSHGKLNSQQIKEALRYMLNKGEIIQLEKGKYRRKYFTDDLIIGCFLVPDGGIAYWSALNYHGLTEQFPNKIFIQNSKRTGEKNLPGLGALYKFIKVKQNKVVGFKNIGFGNHKYRVTDIEKTIVDCFDSPEYSGGYPEIIKAFNKLNLSSQKLVAYCKAINNISVTKRLAYLSELLQKHNMSYFLKYAVSVINEKYTPFDNSINHSGTSLKKWRLILNIPEDEILQMANPIY
jgi:predicted transcriptional regulator of viral defense system